MAYIWSLLCFTQVMYGGRAIDSFDRRILTVYMDEYFGDFIFYTFRRFNFYGNKDVDYKIPPTGPKKIYVGQFSSMPAATFCPRETH